jgi:hypothetical protein
MCCLRQDTIVLESTTKPAAQAQTSEYRISPATYHRCCFTRASSLSIEDCCFDFKMRVGCVPKQGAVGAAAAVADVGKIL